MLPKKTQAIFLDPMADHKQYISKYSNGKKVSAAQYITEIICEKKAKLDKKDLHYRFWVNKEWSVYYRNQIASANKLLLKFSDTAIIRALNNSKATKIYSLRAPHLISIIQEEEDGLNSENQSLTLDIKRHDNVKFERHNKNNGILSKLKDLDNES